MKLMKIVCGFAVLFSLACTAQDKPQPEQPKPETSWILVTQGITGGFVAPHVSQQVLIVPDVEKYHIFSMEHFDMEKPKKVLHGTLSVKEVNDLIAEVEKLGIWKLPVEKPQGTQDIYGQDTSVHFRKDDKTWVNGGPAGCVHGQSEVQATPKDQENFHKITQLIYAAKKAAKTKIDEAKMQENLHKLYKLSFSEKSEK